MNESESRYTFSCPSCAGSFSISLDKIPPVQARFSCPKCGKAMDFPSRDEARVYISLQSSGGGVAPVPAAPPPEAAAAPSVPPPPKPASPRPPVAAPPAPESGAADSTATSARSYRVEKKGFETDVYDRRAMRNLIRSGGILENDMIAVDGQPARRAMDLPELKSLFDLKKSSRLEPPPVCYKHTDRVAHYVCASTERTICEECAEEKKFGGTILRVCEHCGGTVNELNTVAEEGP
ncbi:MAG TPA: MJ0042-type zinc finger domain-containing protein [Thermoanaerobaculia bacterium]|nr:MJ0042-type zinc finger domain-containing protein [Thermoanaerobaculia bacterium]